MKTKKCCICEGRIADGRCVDCGMPYRNDEELYHLNENRRDHYPHASEEAQKKLRALERPRTYSVPAKKGAAAKPSYKKTAVRPRQAVSYGSTKAAASYTKGTNKKNRTAFWVIVGIIIMLLAELWPNLEAVYREYTSVGNQGAVEQSVTDETGSGDR